MTVSCEGDCGVIERLGEKQDFEAALTRRRYRHEDFMLHVLKSVVRGKRGAWNQDYAVTVAHVGSGKTNVYRGGPKHDWVRLCMADIDAGLFGPPM